jgi:hypothetical protein
MSVSRSGQLALTVGAALVVLSAAGCGQPSGADLHSAARSLVPPGATIVLEKDAGCVEGARSPSCVEVYFRLPPSSPLAERLALFLANAQRHGWKAQKHGSGGGEVFVTIGKGSYTGVAGLWLDRYYRPARPHCNPVSVLHPCADHFEVQWKGGIISG